MANFLFYLTGILNNMGYIGILIVVGLEYACFPISSEVLLPFIGYGVYIEGMSILGAIIVATIGAVLGCSFCYGIGRFGRNILDKVLLNRLTSLKEGIKKADTFFHKAGRQSVFWGRFIPIVRTYISFPVGMIKMKYSSFLFYSFAGALLWNSVLISVGYFLGEYWIKVSFLIKENASVIVLICIVSFLLLSFIKHQK